MAKQLRQAGAVARVVATWFKRDLPEILAPASMPDPPGYQRPPRKSSRELAALFLRACRRYVETWDSAKVAAERAAREPHAAEQPAGAAQEEAGPSMAEDFAAAAKGGGQALQPWLASLYQTRAVAYKNAVQQFVGGYKDGFRQAMAPQVPPEVAAELAAQRATEQAGAAGEAGQPVQGSQEAAAAGGEGGAAAPLHASAPSSASVQQESAGRKHPPGDGGTSGSGSGSGGSSSRPPGCDP